MRSSEMKGKQRILGTESCPTASDESENWGGITVYSINFIKNSFLINPNFEICSLTAF